MPQGYPLILNLCGKKCVVIGEGAEADAKAEGLGAAGAEVLRSAGWHEELLEDAFLVVAAGPGREANNAIYEACERRGVLVNCLDDPDRCRFTYPSVHRQGDLILAVSTSGSCPALAVRLRERFEREFGEEYAVFLKICRSLRERLAGAGLSFGERKSIWYSIVDSPALDLLRDGRREEAAREIERLLPR